MNSGTIVKLMPTVRNTRTGNTWIHIFTHEI